MSYYPSASPSPYSSPPPPDETTPPPPDDTPPSPYAPPSYYPPASPSPYSSPPPPDETTPPLPDDTPPSPYAPPSEPPLIEITPPPGERSSKYNTPGTMPVTALVGIIVVAVAALGLTVALSILQRRRRRRRRRRRKQQQQEEASKTKSSSTDYGSEAPLQGPNDDSSSPPADYKGPVLPKPTPPPGIAPTPVPVSTDGKAPSASGSLGADKPFPPPSPGVSPGSLRSIFTYEELKMATDNFSNANLLGQGGFGYVHKGVLPNGKVVAIKQLKAGSGQGEREFQAEVEIISRVHHRHLVTLVGYCISGAQRLLVYEFVPNKTLEFHLHGDGRPTMDWPTRMKIALGSARGLAYLHEDCQPRIIHRDIKCANILIDNSFEAKVADFGLAKYSLDTDTHVSTRVMGTFGYLAPEYAASGKLTEKSDVFSFGVLLLELITGFRPSDRNPSFDDDSMVDWAKPLLAQALEEGNFGPLVDPKLKEYDSTEMARMVACAAASVRHSARRRPRMSQIVRALEGNMPLEDLNDGITPGHSSVYGSYGSSEYNSIKYREDMKKFRKAALEILDLGSSEFSGQTSDDGPNQSSSSTEGQQTTQEMEPQKAEKDTKFASQSS